MKASIFSSTSFRVQIILFFSILLNLACGGNPKTHLPEGEKEIKHKKEIQKTNTFYSEQESVTSATLSQNGDLWFGTNTEGLFRYDGETFTHYTSRDGLHSNYISNIIERKNGSLWLGTDEGLSQFDGKTFSHIPIPWDGDENLWGPNLNAKLVLGLIEDQNENIWFGTWGNGAYRYDGKTFTPFLVEAGRLQADGRYKNVIQTILEDQKGNIWLSSMTHGGITRFDGKKLVNYSLNEGLPDDQIFTVFEDRKGNIWLGCLGNDKGGLIKYDGSSFTNFNSETGLINNNVRALFEDRTGKLWIGSNRAESSIYDGQSFKPFIGPDGEKFSKINFIIEDKKGHIWFGGNYGQLFRYDGKILTDFTQKHAD